MSGIFIYPVSGRLIIFLPIGPLDETDLVTTGGEITGP